MEIIVELKLNMTSDGFTNAAETLEKDTGVAHDTRGQLTTYFNCMQAAQHRTHSFGVSIALDTCRLLRHINSGIEVTQSFDYTKTAYLQTFFWRLSHADAAVRRMTPPLNPWVLPMQPRPVPRMSLYGKSLGERSFYVAALYAISPLLRRAPHGASLPLIAIDSRDVCSRMSGDWMAIIRKAKSTSGYTITVCVKFPKSLPRETLEITAVVSFPMNGSLMFTITTFVSATSS
jgi:hypothetical protein